MIITIARECGSGGHEIGEILSKKLNIALFDKKALIAKAKELDVFDQMESFFNEKPANSLLSAITQNEGLSEVSEKMFYLVRKITEEQSFIIIGRCSNVVFRNNPDVTTLFIHGEYQDKLERTMHVLNLSEKSAKERMTEVDKKRMAFHKYCTGETWGDSRRYQLTINSSLIGSEAATNIILNFIKLKKA